MPEEVAVFAAEELFAGEVAAGAIGGEALGGAVGGELLGGAAAGELGAGVSAGGLAEELGIAGEGLTAGEGAAAAGSFGEGLAGELGVAGAGMTGAEGVAALGGAEGLAGAGIELSDAAVGAAGGVPGGGMTYGSGGGFGGGELADPTAGIGDTGALNGSYGNELTSALKDASTSKSVKDALDKLTKYGPLALGGLSAVGQRNATNQHAKQIAGLGGPQREIGNQLLTQFKSGTLSSSDAAKIAEWEQSALAQSRQYFAKAGTSTSTQARTSENTIKKQAEAMRQQALQSTLKTGLDALNVTDQYQAAAIQAEMQGDQAATQNAFNFLNAYGSWLRAVPEITGEKKAA